MTKSMDKKWWRRYKKMLEKAFEQDSIIIRVQKIDLV